MYAMLEPIDELRLELVDELEWDLKLEEGPGQPGLAHGQSIPQISAKVSSALLGVNNCVSPAVQIDLRHSFRAFSSFKYRASVDW